MDSNDLHHKENISICGNLAIMMKAFMVKVILIVLKIGNGVNGQELAR